LSPSHIWTVGARFPGIDHEAWASDDQIRIGEDTDWDLRMTGSKAGNELEAVSHPNARFEASVFWI